MLRQSRSSARARSEPANPLPLAPPLRPLSPSPPLPGLPRGGSSSGGAVPRFLPSRQAQRCSFCRTPPPSPPTPSRWLPALSPLRSSPGPLRGVSYPRDPGCPTPQLTPPVRAPARLPPLSLAPWLSSPSRFSHRTLSGASSPRSLGAHAAASPPAGTGSLPKRPEALLLLLLGCPP